MTRMSSIKDHVLKREEKKSTDWDLGKETSTTHANRSKQLQKHRNLRPLKLGTKHKKRKLHPATKQT